MIKPVAWVAGTAIAMWVSVAPAKDYSAYVETYERKLKAMGRDPGAIDGRFDQDLAKAVRTFQQSNGLEVSGYLDRPTRQAIDAEAPPIDFVAPGKVPSPKVVAGVPAPEFCNCACDGQ